MATAEALRVRTLAEAHATLAAAAGGGPALFSAIARAAALPCGERARGMFFSATRDRILPIGVDGRGEQVSRSIPSALDIGSWAFGRADGHAPFGYVDGTWITFAVRSGDVRVGGTVVLDVMTPVDALLQGELESVASHAGALLRMRTALEETERMAATDTLTGAATRRRVLAELAHACASRESYCLAYIDLDGFKLVNDTLGHDAGDRILCETVHTLSRSLRPDELVGRLGGDEFVCLVRASVEEAEPIVRRLTNALEDAGIAASIGWSAVRGDAADVLRAADARMYESKAARKRRSLLHVVSE